VNDLRTHLQDMVDKAEWSWLEEHIQEGRLLIVAPTLELVEVGVALAEDNIHVAKQWLDDGWVYRPTDEQIAYWKQNLEFECLIIQPFVLSREPQID
jgi:hypothetical protein